MTHDISNDEPRVKLLVLLPGNDLAPAETLWAKVLDGGLFEIENIPFFVDGLSRGDIVRGKVLDGELRFESIVRPGGRATFRVLTRPEADTSSLLAFRSRLEAIGCGIETATGRLWACDVADDRTSETRAILEAGWRAGAWGYELSIGPDDSDAGEGIDS